MSPLAGRVPGDQLQDTKTQTLALLTTCLTCDLNKRKKTWRIVGNTATRIKTCVTVSEV